MKLRKLKACSGIYVIINDRNGHFYIGSSANVLKRVWAHLDAKPGKGSASVAAAIAKYGRNVLVGYLLEEAPRERLPVCEAKWIRKLNPEYNRSKLTVTGGKIISSEQREKLRQANLGKKMAPHLVEQQRQRMMGHLVSAETREKIRQTKIGKAHSAETRAHMSATWHRSPQSLARMSAVHIGRKHSPETCAKRSAALKGKPWSPARRAAEQERKS